MARDYFRFYDSRMLKCILHVMIAPQIDCDLAVELLLHSCNVAGDLGRPEAALGLAQL
jgi:hypothetical protein